jgi:glycerol-3-phosphate dehydrogenase
MDKEKIYDLAVIGAGIHGAGVAQAAAVNGWTVALVEQFDKPAQGTSSKSSKLIHGGLRYLETGQIKLVRECLRERALLLKLAPETVQLREFAIPLHKHLKRKALTIHIGLLLYWVLSGFSKQAWPKRISKKKALALFPKLKSEGLSGALIYRDAQTDDAELTQKVIRSAQSYGGECFYSHTVQRISKLGDFFEVQFKNDQAPLHCRTLVNAAGPWVNQLAERISPTVPVREVDLVQGSHIILNIEAPNHCLYTEAEDGRAVFILPWHGLTMVGTTERDFLGSPENCSPSDDEIEYLLACYDRYFPEQGISKSHITQQFAGLRVLPEGEGPNKDKPRETVFVTRSAAPAYLAIYGGKLTAYRDTAERVMAELSTLCHRPASKNTRDIPLE